MSEGNDLYEAPAWVQLLPRGEWFGVDGRGPYRLADAAAVIKASGGPTVDLPIDYDHQIDRSRAAGGLAPAAGWIKELQERPDGIWGRVEWTERAKQHLAAKEYRFISPVITHAKDGTVLLLQRAGLTNDPNFRQLKALASIGFSMQALDATELEICRRLNIGPEAYRQARDAMKGKT